MNTPTLTPYPGGDATTREVHFFIKGGDVSIKGGHVTFRRGKAEGSASGLPPVAGPYWRAQLPRLEGLGLILLPIGAKLPDRKVPVDPETGYGLSDWEKHPGFSAAEIAAMKPHHVIGACIHTGPSGLDVLDLDGPAAVAWAEAHGVNPRDPALFRITRTTDPDRFKIPFRLTPEQRMRFPQVKNLLRVGEPDAEGKRQAIETYAKTGAQVIVLGQHCKSGGWYCWAGDPASIGPPSEEWLQVLIALAAEVASLRGKGDTSRPPGKAGRGCGKWQASSRAHPCPVCGRDHSAACTRMTSADGRLLVSCFHGGTFSPDTSLQIGDVITGRDGNRWALTRTYYADCLGEKSLFIDDQPRAGGGGGQRDFVADFDVEEEPEPRQQSANGSGTGTPAEKAGGSGERRADPDPPIDLDNLLLDPDYLRTFEKYWYCQSKDADWIPRTIGIALGSNKQNWALIEGILHRKTSTHYTPLDDQALAPRITQVLERLYYVKEATRKKPEEIIHHWARPARVKEALDWFKKTLVPCRDFNPSNAINCRNGVLSWSWDGPRMVLTFGPHNHAEVFTYCLQYDYDPHADGKHLQRLLGALETKDHDTMKRLLGSGLQLDHYRATRGRPRALLLLGDGENGKDTIRGALLQTLGARGMTGCTLSDFQQYDKGRKFPLARLRGARINWSPENTNYARLEAIQSLKGAITGDELSWEQKNIQEEEFAPNAIFLFNCNQPPLMDGAQAAMQSRWHAVRFLRRYSSSPDPSDPNQLQADPRLKDDLQFIRESICPAMLNWLLEGLRLAVSDGINFRSNPETIEAIRRQSCHLFDFAEEVGLVADSAGELEHRRVWTLLEGWYQDHKILHLEDSGRRSWNDKDMHGDQPVRIPRDLERRLRAVFPKLTSRRVPKTRSVVLLGLTL